MLTRKDNVLPAIGHYHSEPSRGTILVQSQRSVDGHQGEVDEEGLQRWKGGDEL